MKLGKFWKKSSKEPTTKSTKKAAKAARRLAKKEAKEAAKKVAAAAKCQAREQKPQQSRTHSSKCSSCGTMDKEENDLKREVFGLQKNREDTRKENLKLQHELLSLTEGTSYSLDSFLDDNCFQNTKLSTIIDQFDKWAQKIMEDAGIAYQKTSSPSPSDSEAGAESISSPPVKLSAELSKTQLHNPPQQPIPVHVHPAAHLPQQSIPTYYVSHQQPFPVFTQWPTAAQTVSSQQPIIIAVAAPGSQFAAAGQSNLAEQWKEYYRQQGYYHHDTHPKATVMTHDRQQASGTTTAQHCYTSPNGKVYAAAVDQNQDVQEREEETYHAPSGYEERMLLGDDLINELNNPGES